jgi:hypothetical protein
MPPALSSTIALEHKSSDEASSVDSEASLEDDSSSEEEDEEEWKATKQKRKAAPPPPPRHKKQSNIQDEDEDDELSLSAARALTASPPDSKNMKKRSSPPKRSSAVKAGQQVSKFLDQINSSDDASDSKPSARKKTKRSSPKQRKQRHSTGRDDDDDDSDEEFDPNARSESDAEDDDELEEEEDDDADGLEEDSPDDLVPEISAKARSQRSSDDKTGSGRRRASIGIVRDGEVGTADDSSDDNFNNSPRPPQLEIRPSPRRRGQKNTTISPNKKAVVARKNGRHAESDGDESSSAETDESTTKIPPCGSTVDIITGEDLPRKHVCFYTPDQQSCQCFALETMRKIALSASSPQYRQTNTGRAVQTFLQPPHFRTSMSDDLLDQIASRFGRDALQVNGPYYRRKETIAAPVTHWEAVGMPILPDRHDDDNFHDLVRNYIGKTMGSQDIYVCPLCYIVAHSRLQSNETTDEPYETDFSKDPMSVLGYLDNDAFTVSSAFCFRKVATLKEHLRQDHGVATSIVQGNSFYSRYKVRVFLCCQKTPLSCYSLTQHSAVADSSAGWVVATLPQAHFWQKLGSSSG